MTKVLIVDTRLDSTGLQLLNTISAVTELAYYATVAKSDRDTLEGLMDSGGHYLLIFVGGVPKSLAEWLVAVLKVGEVPVFIVVGGTDYDQEWLNSPALVFTTAAGAKNILPFYVFEEKLSRALGLS